MKKKYFHTLLTMYNPKSAFFWLLFFFPAFSFCQTIVEIDSIAIQLHSVPLDGEDTVNFVFIEAKNKSDTTLIFVQGSGPRPLFYREKGKYLFSLPFEIDKVVNDHNTNLLMVAPPGVNCLEEGEILDDNLYKVDEKQWPILKYREGNRLDTYINRFEIAMEFVSNKIPNSNFFLLGHSQGSRIAAVLGGKRSDVSKVALASVNPISRSYETISKSRIRYLRGEIDFDESQALIEEEYKRVWTMKNKQDKNLEDVSELSFTSPSLLSSMLKLEQPVRFVYGTHDFGTSVEADKIMLEFINNNKTNLTTKVYEDMNHNLFEGDVWGWDLFFKDIMNWFQKQ